MVGFKKVEDNHAAGDLGRHDDPLHDALSRPAAEGQETPAAQIAIGIITIQFLDFLRS